MTEESEEVMFQIQDTLVSLDLAEEFFCCDLEACKGECCIEGDAGAPVTDKECREIRRALPFIEKDMAPRAIELVREQGVSYIDEEGDLVTTILDGRNCAFTCYGPNGVCLCALEGAFRRGGNNLAQARELRAIPRPHHRIREVHRHQLPSLERLQGRTRKRPQGGHPPLSVP